MFSESDFQSFSPSDMESEENKGSSEEVPFQHLTSQGEWIASQHLTSQYLPFFTTLGIKEKPFRLMDSLPFCVL